MRTILSVFSIAAAIAIILRVYLRRENARRDRVMENTSDADMTGINEAEDDMDITDKEDLLFRYLM